MLSEIRTPEFLLRQWGLWARSRHGLKLYFPSATNFERMRAGSGEGCMLTDDEAASIDAVVSKLKIDSDKAHSALALYYIAGMTYRDIAKEMDCHHRTAADFTEQGRVYFKAALRFGAPNAA